MAYVRTADATGVGSLAGPKQLTCHCFPCSIQVIPRVIFDLFAQISAASLSPSGRREYVVRCSFVQIYNEQIMDLLNPSHLQQAAATAAKRSRTKLQSKARTGLRLRWSAAREFYVENLCVLECESPEQVLAHFHSGLQHKVMASHRMNAASSRSHCIFTLYVESFDPSENPNDVLTSKLALVDLAGSERVERTGATGVTLQESIGINKSLFVLRQVIQALSEESNAVPAKELLAKAPSDRAYIPYRDSKLTSLLKDSLGGNSVTLMIACISPSDASYDENLSTLVYASKAQCIANRPTKNEDPKTAMVHELQQEVESLRRQLSQAHATILSFQQTMPPALPAPTSETAKKEERPSTDEPLAETLPGALHSETNEKPPAPRREPSTTTKQLKWNVIENVDMIKQLYATEKQLSERVRSQAERIDGLQYETRVLNVENQSLREKMEVLEYLVATVQPATQDHDNNEDEEQDIPEYGVLGKQSTPFPVPTAERIRRALRHKASTSLTPTSSKRKSKIAPHVESSNHSSGSRREPESTGLLSVRGSRGDCACNQTHVSLVAAFRAERPLGRRQADQARSSDSSASATLSASVHGHERQPAALAAAQHDRIHSLHAAPAHDQQRPRAR